MLGRAAEDVYSDALMARAQWGDATAFSALYLRYYDLLYGYVRMMLQDAHEAEDVTQDVFIRVLRLLPYYEIRAGRPLRVLLLRIAHNRSIDYLRRRKQWDVQAPVEIEERRDGIDLHRDPPGAFDKFSDTRLADLVERLPLRQRQVIVLRYQFNLPTPEVAEVINSTPSAVRNLHYRGLRSLRAALARASPLAHPVPPGALLARARPLP